MPFVQQHVVVPTNATTVSGLPASSVVGASPQWGDDSASTYARVMAKVGSLFANEYGAGLTELDPIPDLSTTRTQRLAVWYQAAGSDPVPARIGLSTAAGSQYLFRTNGWTDPDETPPHAVTDLTAPAGWDVAELFPAEGATPEALLGHWLANPVWLDWTSGVPGSLEPAATTEWYTDVYEMRLVVYIEVPALFPLRQWPVTHGWGLGSARRVWPPDRSVHNSLRQGPGSYL